MLGPLVKCAAEFLAVEWYLLSFHVFDPFNFKVKDQPIPTGGYGGIVVVLLILFSCFPF